MTSQVYSATIGGVVYNVTAAVGGVAPSTGEYVVTAYGADSTGVADSRTAINNALAAASAAGGGDVVVPAGTYRVTLSGGIGINFSGLDNIRLVGSPGAVIKLADSQCVAASAYYFVLMSSTTSNITIRDLVFDGNGENNATFTVADVLTVVGENIVVDGCRIVNAPDSGIMLSAAKYCKIVNNYIDGNSVSNGAATPATGWTTGATTDLGIYVNDGRTGAGASGSAEIGYDSGAAALVDCVISGNTIRRFRSGGIGIKRVSTGIIVSDNTITGCGNGITFENASYTGDSSLKCTITGNRCTDIGWINASTGGRGINLRWSHYSVVSGNYVENCHGQSLMIEGTQRASISNNVLIGSATLYSTEQKGIMLVARPDGTAANVYSTHNSVTGNVVSAHHRSGIVGDSSVYTNLNAKNQIHGNVVVGNGVTSGANYSGILLETAAADDTTPSVLGMRVLKIPANSGANVITRLDDSYAGHVVTLYCGSSTNPSTISDGGNFLLNGDWLPAVAGDTITLINMDGTVWAEISRNTDAWSGHSALSDVVYDDIIISPSSAAAFGGTAMTTAAWLTDLRVIQGINAGGEYSYYAMQLPHNYAPGTNLLFHVHFANTATIADTETVVFTMKFTAAPIWGLFGATGTATATFTNNSTTRAQITAVAPGQISGTGILANTHLIAGGATITGTTYGLSTVLYGRLERGGADGHGSAVNIISIDAHIQKNRLGSENEYTG